jgi:hypothetical protein
MDVEEIYMKQIKTNVILLFIHSIEELMKCKKSCFAKSA